MDADRASTSSVPAEQLPGSLSIPQPGRAAGGGGRGWDRAQPPACPFPWDTLPQAGSTRLFLKPQGGSLWSIPLADLVSKDVGDLREAGRVLAALRGRMWFLCLGVKV